MKPPAVESAEGVASPPASARRPLFSDRTRAGLGLLLRLLVGGVFVYAGALKLADPAKFATDVGNYRLAPREWLNLIAIILPGVEVVAGFFVIAGIWLRAAALVIAGLTTVFLLAIISALARGLNIECGCFGTVGGHQVGIVSLALDATLLVFAVFLAATSRAASAAAPPPVAPD